MLGGLGIREGEQAAGNPADPAGPGGLGFAHRGRVAALERRPARLDSSVAVLLGDAAVLGMDGGCHGIEEYVGF